MRLLKFEFWGIKARIIFIAVVPVVIMFLAVVIYSSYSRLAETKEELKENGSVLASALSHSIEYSVASGNLSYAEHITQSLLRNNIGIVQANIFDASKNPILVVKGEGSSDDGSQTFEEPIRRELLDLDSFSTEGEPQTSSPQYASPHTYSNETIGYVRVQISASPILAKQRQRILIAAEISAIALLISVALGLYLAIGFTRPLAKTISILSQIRKGNYDIKIDVTSGGEVGDLQLSLLEMTTSLNQYKQDMESKVNARTQDLEAARDQAMKSNVERQMLIQKVHSVVEEERKGVAMELHDQLNASLIVARLESQRIIDLASYLPGFQPIDEIKARATSIVKLTSDLYKLCRNIVQRLRPEIIDTLGLKDAIEEMINHYDEIHPKCRFEFQAVGSFDFTDELSITTYRLIQEALSNVVKHSDATMARVRIETLLDDDVLLIEVVDNGHGFKADTPQLGVGLIGMRERVHWLNGKIQISGKSSAGTSVHIELPLQLKEMHKSGFSRSP